MSITRGRCTTSRVPGGQQGDPLEMIRFCAAIHPVWGRVMSRYQHARALAFADDGYGSVASTPMVTSKGLLFCRMLSPFTPLYR